MNLAQMLYIENEMSLKSWKGSLEKTTSFTEVT